MLELSKYKRNVVNITLSKQLFLSHKKDTSTNLLNHIHLQPKAFSVDPISAKHILSYLRSRHIYISFAAPSSLQDPRVIYKRHLIGYPLNYSGSQHQFSECIVYIDL